METYIHSSNTERGPAKEHQSFWDFLFKYAVVVAAFGGFGYEVRDFSPVLASASCFLGLMVFFRGFWAWCNTRLKIVSFCIVVGAAAVSFAWFDYNWIRDQWTPTFLNFVPSRELIDCDRRAFFVNHSGLRRLENVRVIIKDNKSGSIEEIYDYKNGVEPGPQNPDAPRYIWVKPSHPWDEDYTITVTGSRFRSVQETVIRSFKQGVRFAAEIKVDSRKMPVLICRDNLLPDGYLLGKGAKETCDKLMGVDQTFLSRLHPEPYGFQRPNGSYALVRPRLLPTATDLDAQSDDRHLTEFEQTIMRSKLSTYRGTKILILYAGGPKTLAYAMEFRDFFGSLQWNVDGPRSVPVGNERVVDVQISISDHFRATPNQRAIDLLNSVEGIKHRQRNVVDPSISPDLIVLWVGPKSPGNFKPDDCAPAFLHQRPGEPHTCEIVAQVPGFCPIPPE
ncbi:MAG: hypothetical protein LAO08_09465 [Acidobacteriia bacterium]|nr:hypothetical protein [Terriglobia bacterium]